MFNFQEDLALLLAMAAIFSGLLSPVLGLDFAMGTSGEGEGNGGGDDTSGDDTSGDDTSGDGTDSELQPDPDPCLEDPALEGCEDPCLEDPTLEGCEPSVGCDPSYNICVTSPPPDLNCDDISDRNFKVVGSDPHRFDGDNDGIGCEGSNRGGGSGGGSSGGSGNSDGSSSSTDECQGQADCFRGTVTEIVDAT